MTTTTRRPAISLLQAAQEAPTLARLAELARESSDRLKTVQFLIPAPLRSAVRPGPIGDGNWCLLVSGNAAAAKLRQVLPAIAAHLSSRGIEVGAIRLKVQIGNS